MARVGRRKTKEKRRERRASSFMAPSLLDPVPIPGSSIPPIPAGRFSTPTCCGGWPQTVGGVYGSVANRHPPRLG